MEPSFEQIVEAFYQPLYRFAFALSQSEAEACDLTQQTFYLWAAKGHQLRDRSKIKSWLFTTLHRDFLGKQRRTNRFPHLDLEAAEADLPDVSPEVVNEMDGETVMQTLLELDDLYRAPLLLYYLEDHSYHEIARILNVPPGTVMSRLSRGKAQLRQALAARSSSKKIVPMPAPSQRQHA